MLPPNLILNEEELDLLDGHPEECLRHAVQRNAIQLDLATQSLSPRLSAIVQRIATGERLTASSQENVISRSLDLSDATDQERQQQELVAASTRAMLANHPTLTHMLDEQALTPAEAMEAAHAIDHVLGRYLTGARYAVP
jgi:hypothetical protein